MYMRKLIGSVVLHHFPIEMACPTKNSVPSGFHKNMSKDGSVFGHFRETVQEFLANDFCLI